MGRQDVPTTPFMRPLARLLAALLTPMCALAVEPGDTLEQVLEEKGSPAGRMEAAGAVVLRYETETITLRDGKVVTVKAAPAKSATAITPALTAAPTQRPTPPRRAPAPAAASVDWTTDYSAALAAAKSGDRKVLLYFTGSDWCGWCKRLTREILATPEFAAYAAEELVLVKLDFPRALPQPPELVKQNEQLARRYRIRGYPTVVMLDASGRTLARLGYQEGGPQPFIDRIRAL